MMKTTLILSAIVVALVYTGCNKEEEGEMTLPSMFKVSIENVMLYGAGTEINELPGVVIHQPARLNGDMDENGYVRTVDDMFTYPAVSSAVKITITPM